MGLLFLSSFLQTVFPENLRNFYVPGSARGYNVEQFAKMYLVSLNFWSAISSRASSEWKVSNLGVDLFH